MTTTAEFIAGFEGYAGRAYWDVNAWRLGYGSDTEGPEQAHVTEGMETTKARALQNLSLRIPQFQQDAIREMGGTLTWQRLTSNQQSAITSLVYNYGRLPIVVYPSDAEKTAAGIRALQGANGGVNRKRRLAEAAFYLTPDIVVAQQPTPAPQPTPTQPIPPAPQPAPAPLPGFPPSSAYSAGRRAAEAAYIKTMLDQLLAERAALEEEIGAFQDMWAKLGKISPTPALPAPPLITIGTNKMALPTFLINWKTTLAGAVAVFSAVAPFVPALAPYAHIFDSLGLGAAGVVGLMAKDNNVTGGTVSAVTGKEGSPVSLVDRQ